MISGEFIAIGHSKSSNYNKYVEFFNHASQSWETVSLELFSRTKTLSGTKLAILQLLLL